MKLLIQCVAVGAGGALGAIARFLVAMLCGRMFATDFPVGTFIINITGSFFLGWFLTMARSRLMMPATLNMAIAVGFVGAYTTFSTYMWESSRLIGDGEEIKAAANVIGSIVVGLIAVYAGAYWREVEMSLLGEQVLLRIYLQSADRAPHTPTYQRIIKAARQSGLAGATVLRGLPEDSRFSLVEHAPVIVEIVDSAEKISLFVDDTLDKLMLDGIATLERAAVMMYRHGKDKPHALQLLSMPPPLSTLPQIQPRPNMTIKENGVLLRVFLGESDRFEHKPLHEAIVRRARELGLAGASVLRGTEGFGANSVVHKASLLEMSADLPIVIELVDAEDKVKLLLPHLETMVTEGMITMEHVMIVLYRHNPADAHNENRA